MAKCHNFTLVLNFRKYYPIAELKPFVQSYYIVRYKQEDDKEEAMAPMSNHPQGTIDLMFFFEGGMHVTTTAEEDLYLEGLCIMAQQERNFQVKFTDGASMMGVVFYGEAFSKLMHFPLADILNSGVVISDEANDNYGELYERLYESIADADRVALMDEFLLGEVARNESAPDQFDKLVAYIRESKGLVSVSELTDMANLTERSLQRKMKKVTGVTPKTYSGVIRFNYALALLASDEEKDWHDVLFESGYYDQAHFIKDFKRYTGKTPSEYIKGDQGLSEHFLNR